MRGAHDVHAERDPVEIVGAGPAGLAAAITLARFGQRVVVHEMHGEVGHRFGADLQGLENWSTRIDVLDGLRADGITTAFDKLPCHCVPAFDAWNGRHDLRSAQPLVYVVQRGPGPGTLDTALLQQALALGVDVRFGSRIDQPRRAGILAGGPRGGRAIAVGYHFDTDMADGAWLILDDEVAPLGYAYLLVMNGRGTIKSCMFTGFRQEREYVRRTVERLQGLTRLSMRNARFHGGVANFTLPVTAKLNAHTLVGERAGFQDALAGFGIRYAIRSGILAARALLGAEDYDVAWQRDIRPGAEASHVNRAIYERLGNRGYRWLLRAHVCSGDARRCLRWLYAPAPWQRRLLPWVQRNPARERLRNDDVVSG